MLRMSLINRLLLTTALVVTACSAAQGTEDILPAVDIPRQKIIMLQVSASDCNYCVILEEELIKPMLRSGDYDNDVLIRKVDIDSYKKLSGFDGQSISGPQLAKMLDIKVTSTLIFLNSESQEVSKRIVGVNSLEYMGAYVDDAIKHGLASIR